MIYSSVPVTLRIVAVAVKTYDGVVHSKLPPHRHHHLLQSSSLRPYLRQALAIAPEEGFLTNDGHFVDRATAMRIAQANGQLNRSPDPKHYQGPDLYSEDLW